MNKLWVKILSVTLCVGVFVGCILIATLLGGAKEFTIGTTEVRTEFVVGEDFSYEGLTAKQGDRVITDFKVDSSSFDKTKVGEYEIIVIYRSYSASYIVRVVM